ncbi:MAG: metal-dependent hydrolase [Pseudomonadota bacterium]
MAIVKRDIHFDLSNAPRFWCGGDKIATAFFNSLSVCLPHAERYIIRSVMAFRSNIDSQSLIDDIAGFKTQEAIHTREHQNYNDQLRSLGYDVDGLEKAQKNTLDWFENSFGRKRNLAITACMEHFTSILAEAVLSRPELLADADPGFRDIWEWHALEEVEHSSVSFDVLQEVRSGYFYRCSTMLIATFEFVKLINRNFGSLLRADRNVGDRKGVLSVLNFLFGQPGFIRALILPYFAFFRPGFHPAEAKNKENLKRIQLVLEQRMVQQAA